MTRLHKWPTTIVCSKEKPDSIRAKNDSLRIHCHQLARLSVTRRGQISNLANKAIRSKKIKIKTPRKSRLHSGSVAGSLHCLLTACSRYLDVMSTDTIIIT